jgi:hypothetical protein
MGHHARGVRSCGQTKNQSGNEDCSRAFHAIVSISMAASQPLQLRQDILALRLIKSIFRDSCSTDK